MIDRWCNAFVWWNIRHRGLMLALLTLVTVGFAIVTSRLRVHSAFADLLPQRHPYVQVHNEFNQTFGGGNLVLVAVERKDGTVFQAETLKKIETITEAVDRMDGVNHFQVFSIAHRKAKTAEISGSFVEQKAVMWPEVPTDPEAIRRIQERVGASPLLCGPYVSSDHTSVLITAQFHDGQIDYHRLFRDFKEIIDGHTDARHDIHVAGVPMLVGWGYFYLREILLAFGVALAIMIVILAGYFRSWQGVLLPLLSAIVSAIWGLGFAALLGINLDPLILVVPMLVSARALSHSVQFMEKFYETLREHPDKRKAATVASEALFGPGWLGIGTDALGILLIALSTIPMMQKLAFFCSVWSASIVFSVLVLNPILLTILPVPCGALNCAPGRFGRALDALLGAVASLMTGRRRWAMVAGALVIGAVAYVVSWGLVIGDISVGSGILRSDSHYDRSLRRITQQFFGASPLFVFVRGRDGHVLTEPDVARAVEQFQRTMEADPNVKGTISYVDLIRYFHEVMREGDPKWSLLPRDKRGVGGLLSCIADTSSPGDIERFLTMDYRHAVIQVFYKDTRGSTVSAAVARAKQFIASHPLKDAEFALAGGVVGLKAAVNEEVVWSNDLTYGLILGCIFLWSSFSFRSFLIGGVLTGCTALSNYCVFAMMTLWGIELNIHTLPVSSMGVGIGVDYGFYLLARAQEELRRGRRSEGAMREAILTTGKAIFLTAGMMVVGVGLWDFLTHVKFIGEMGLLLALLMLFNMVVALTVLPSVMLILKPKSLRGEETEVRSQESEGELALTSSQASR